MTRSDCFGEEDLRQIADWGLTLEKVLSDIERCKKGFPVVRLQRPCTVGDGLTVLRGSELDRLGQVHVQAASAGRITKFVPASGAASRMFQLLLSLMDRLAVLDGSQSEAAIDPTDRNPQMFLQFIRNLKQFAFSDELRSVMARDGLQIEQVVAHKRYADLLTYLLTPTGLNYANVPKGLIPFHRYADHSRTPLEEHLVEAAAYAQDQDGVARVHFTVPPEYQEAMRAHVETLRPRYERLGCRFIVTFSVQKPSTDTLAVDQWNEPFRDETGRLVFRPAGHGALLENLNDLQGDIIFIKNIDNLARKSQAERKAFLAGRLNRPLRVCGVVQNTGEPGGGPFWVRHPDNTLSLQIIEAAQVDIRTAEQRALWEAATHFNPVDLVCGVQDYRGRPFDLPCFSDPDTGFIAQKSKDGKVLRALELPGLWNGAMARWNTVFVEVPLSTFNPVKTVFDLLRDAHRGA